SSMTDTILLLRYAEQAAQVKRALVVLKMRGSDQDKAVREFTVSDRGIRVGEPLQGKGGSLLGFTGV
ncbi:MAG TPA: ATPase domain-containing protein, partial [Gammaproteobacteria bacterium]|nr:ATPase domain-containing protein [Gammaproteobacteria bacterium]